MAFLIVEKGPADDLGKTLMLAERPLVIGRGGSGVQPELVLHDPYVSRRHAEIVFEQGHYLLRDLGSTNGTIVDGMQSLGSTPSRLLNGALIGLGISSGLPRVLLRFTDATTLVSTKVQAEQPRSFRNAWLSIKRESQEVWIDGKCKEMSRKEYDLICYLEANAGRVCRKDDMIPVVWPEVLNPGAVSDAAVDQLIHRLRTKIELDPKQPTRIVSKKGFGYLLVV
jgi:pSer/pThr/pTyr-binding forkhead associated (FHA) protein